MLIQFWKLLYAIIQKKDEGAKYFFQTLAYPTRP